MTTIALTGGIASGKTTIARRLRELGAVVLDADEFARDAVAPGSKGLRDIRERFGGDVIQPDGSLDRAALAAIVFSHEDERLALNDIVHPEIRRLTDQKLAQTLADDPDAIIVHDIPLLLESRNNYDYDEIWVADAPADVREQRLVEGRGMDREEARGRIAAQVSDEDRRRLADVLIDTTGTIADTIEQVDALWDRVSADGREDAATVHYGAAGRKEREHVPFPEED